MSEPVIEDGEEDAARVERREPAFNLSAVVMVLIVICTGIHLIRAYGLTVEQDFGLLLRGAFIPLRYSGAFELDLYALTSPVTYAFLHGDFAHLLINMIWLAAFGPPLANRFGPWLFLSFWIFAALAAVGLHYLVYPLDEAPLIGASGAVSGMMGAAARYGFRTDRLAGKPVFGGPRLSVAAALSSRTVVVFLAVWMAVNLVSGLGLLSPGMENPIAWEAHIGGFLAGFFCVALFDRSPPRPLDLA
jgi:membrane associated rhomboid family serine protease